MTGTENTGNIIPIGNPRITVDDGLAARLLEEGMDVGRFFDAVRLDGDDIINSAVNVIRSFDQRNSDKFSTFGIGMWEDGIVRPFVRQEEEEADYEAVSSLSAGLDASSGLEKTRLLYLYPSGIGRCVRVIERRLNVIDFSNDESEVPEAEFDPATEALRCGAFGYCVLALTDASVQEYLDAQTPEDQVIMLMKTGEGKYGVDEGMRRISLRFAGAVATRYLTTEAGQLLNAHSNSDMALMNGSLAASALKVNPAPITREVSFALEQAYNADQMEMLADILFADD